MPRNNQNVQRKRERDGDEERWKRRKKKGKRTLKTTHMYTKESREDDIC